MAVKTISLARLSRKQFVLFTLPLFLFLVVAVVGKPSSVSALAGPVPSTVAPLSVRNDITYRCTTSGWNVVQDQWISPIGSPASTSITVPYGTASIGLQLNWITYRCRTGVSPATILGSFKVTSTSPATSLVGYVGDMNYVPTYQTGYLSGVSKTFTYNGPFTGTTIINLNMYSKGTISKSNGTYVCAVVNTEPQVSTTGKWNFDPQPGYCVSGSSLFSLRVNVTPPANLDGYKIDDQGYDATLRPAGGNLNAAYNTLPVTVSGVGTQSPNPFLFTTASGGGPAIPVATTGSQVRTVSVNTSALPATYDLIGYAICDAAQAGCTSANLEFGNPSFYHTLGSSSSFNWTFLSGHNYHMRWVFRFLAPVSCGTFTTSPPRFDPAQKFTATTTVKYGAAYVPTNPRMTLSFAPAINFNGNPATMAATVSGSIATSVFGTAASGLGPTITTGVFNANWSYTDDFRVAAGLPPVVCPSSTTSARVEVANEPYLQVYGGDVAAGTMAAQTASGQQCVSSDTGNEAGVYSWNNRDINYSGAAAQYAVLALGQILDFSSSSAGLNPSALSFANSGLDAVTQLNPSSGLFGGSFAGSTSNSCDFTSDLTTTPNTSADDIIGGHTVFAASSPEIHYVVNHDVYITGNIMYDTSGAWTTVDQIPYFKTVVVGGNIYIDSSVTQLDGLYVAEAADDGSGTMVGGTIYTCATGVRLPVDPTLVGAPPNTFYSLCHNKLTINGAFAAQQVQFLRTFGTVGRAVADTWASNNAAEVFNYSPEVWLPRTSKPGIGAKADAIIGLPPVL